jgi:hypothetical protein
MPRRLRVEGEQRESEFFANSDDKRDRTSESGGDCKTQLAKIMRWG